MTSDLDRKREAQRRFREKNPNYYRDKMKERKERDPEAYAIEARRIALMASYGITPLEYEAMFKKQKGQCAICGSTDPGQRTKRFLCVDHNHKTGKVRGLLCHRCNRGLGLLGDSIKVLTKASKYLKGELACQRKK
jgi:Recombination endonuclease VII